MFTDYSIAPNPHSVGVSRWLAETPSTELSAGVISTLIYFDLFAHPLTREELFAYLPCQLDSASELDPVLDRLERIKVIGSLGGYYFLRERGTAVVRRRLEMERHGGRMHRRARLIGAILRHTPFVRGVFISGQLAHAVADEQSDIDYFVVAAENRLWICRSLMVLLRRTLLLNDRTYLCTNYFVSEENLAIRERNIYVAHETAAVRPLVDDRTWRRFQRANPWITEFFPNYFRARRRRDRTAGRSGSLLQRLLERVMPSWLLDRLDVRLLRATRRHWERKFPHLEATDTSLHSCRDESRAYPEDQSLPILRQYHEAMKRFGLE